MPTRLRRIDSVAQSSRPATILKKLIITAKPVATAYGLAGSNSPHKGSTTAITCPKLKIVYHLLQKSTASTIISKKKATRAKR